MATHDVPAPEHPIELGDYPLSIRLGPKILNEMKILADANGRKLVDEIRWALRLYIEQRQPIERERETP